MRRVFGVDESTGRGAHLANDKRRWDGRGVDDRCGRTDAVEIRFGVDVECGSNETELHERDEHEYTVRECRSSDHLPHDEVDENGSWRER